MSANDVTGLPVSSFSRSRCRGARTWAPRRRGLTLGIVALALAGCASVAEGVTRALLDDRGVRVDDTRDCEIAGGSFDGLRAMLEEQAGFPALGSSGTDRPILKVLMVHGIGTHRPGYAATLETNLAQALGLEVSAPQPIRFEVREPQLGEEPLGTLSVARYANDARDREMLFFELTWSRISDRAKADIAFDTAETHARQRAAFNRLAKAFVNDAAPDPLVYVGVGRAKILAAVTQSICWMGTSTWDTLPRDAAHCDPGRPGYGDRLEVDQLAFISHSLGSRVVLDALEGVPGQFARRRAVSRIARLSDDLRDNRYPVFMLSNQLPLLQAGFAPPAVRGETAAYCRPEGSRFTERTFAETRIVAFSDPNDLVSYPIPDEFVQARIDSRLCPAVDNVILNVAPVRSAFGAFDFANPLSAHREYEADERVIAMIADGLGRPWSNPLVEERCRWNRTADDLRPVDARGAGGPGMAGSGAARAQPRASRSSSGR